MSQVRVYRPVWSWRACLLGGASVLFFLPYLGVTVFLSYLVCRGLGQAAYGTLAIMLVILAVLMATTFIWCRALLSTIGAHFEMSLDSERMVWRQKSRFCNKLIEVKLAQVEWVEFCGDPKVGHYLSIQTSKKSFRLGFLLSPEDALELSELIGAD